MPGILSHEAEHEVEIVHKGRIAIDWDGTLIEDNKWPDMGDWLPGARAALHQLARDYDEVVIYTLRTIPLELDGNTPRDPSDQYEAIGRMLKEAGLPSNVRLWIEPYKPPAQFYVDNRAIWFDGDWRDTMTEIRFRRGDA